MKTHFEPHPVTPERKAELRAQGFRILDARFAPDGWKPVQAEEPVSAISMTDAFDDQVQVVAKRGRPRKVAD